MTGSGPAGLLSERRRPQRLAEVVGNGPALRALAAWADEWAPGRPHPRRRAALLEGPPGVGKTTAAWALARERGWTVVEMNASEARNRDAIEQVAGRAALTNAFSDAGTFVKAREGGRTLIILDEADCLSGRATEERAGKSPPVALREFLRTRYGRLDALAEAWGLGAPGAPPAFKSWEEVPATAGRGAWLKLKPAQRDVEDWRGASSRIDHSDRGGLGAIATLVRTSRQPVVLTVNDPEPLTRYSPVFRQSVARIRFQPIPESEMRALLRRIIVEENGQIPGAALEAILRRSGGDLRAALNDLDAVLPLPPGPAQLAALGGRDTSSDLTTFIAEALARPHYYRSVEIRDRLDVAPDELLPWVEENLPRAALDATHRYAAFEVLGRADLQLVRARRYRHYGLWSYAGELMTGGVNSALERPEGAPPVEARFPGFLFGMGRTRTIRALRQSVLRKVGTVGHLSVRKGAESILPFLFRLFDPPRPGFNSAIARSARAGLIHRTKMTAEEVAFLLGVEPEHELVGQEMVRANGREPDPDVSPTPAEPPARAVVEPTPTPKPEKVAPPRSAARRKTAAAKVPGTKPKKTSQASLGDF